MTAAGGHHRHRAPTSIAIDVGAPTPRMSNHPTTAASSS
eukprot:CAMPEP_0201890038 /NCGR_PEP_ID=MMETSP0902-20130614/31447_1 /ASSEMBLY_ACC=CAM_ASM_000551 /TAXON_ID=420261 /ORGANISM="Thalassiosira antarctica, Strain CCMP982" /LENGTH=38 /DNA_ID= /DNA_START= /DNA_END= /DNA_ORIENTATION=